MGALELVHRGIRYTVIGRVLTVSRGHLRLAKLDLCPGAHNPARMGEFRQEGDRAWAPLEGAVEGRAVLQVKSGYTSYTVAASGKHFDSLTCFR